EFNATAAAYPEDQVLHRLFEEQVERHPEGIALRGAGEVLTYGQLNARANRIAHALIARGVEPETCVGLSLQRNADLVAATLGILKAGGAYLPLDPRLPSQRRALIRRDADLRHFISLSSLTDQFDDTFLFLDKEDLEAFSEHNPQREVRPENLAYVIYTSGSTGQPKGVLIEHRAIVSRVSTLPELLGETVHSPALVTAGAGFDPFIEQLMLGLAYGQPVILMEEELSDAELFWETIRREGVRRADLVPSLARRLFEALPSSPLPLTQVLLGGEAVLPDLLRLIRAKAPHLQIFNMYGPTEATVECVAGRIDEEVTDIVPIGRPVANAQAYILDPQGHLQPVGVPGELCVGGVQLARGYLNRPELTRERFIANPFGEGRLYRTGDRARWLDNGEIEYLGRIDQQVKIRGFRIELGEIESALREHPQVSDALVQPFGEKGEQRLCAYVVGDFEAAELRRHLSARLPDYMVPAAFVKLDAIPLTPSGKADRKNLPDPEFTSYSAYEPPRTETEKVLCALYAAVLGLEKAGLHDHFFESGGDSILALQLVAKARAQGFDIRVRDLFKAPRVVDLALRARKVRSLWGSEARPEAPLTPIQRWFFEQEGEVNHYNQSMLIRVPSALDLQRLQRAMARVVERHDALRLKFADGKQSLLGRDAFAGDELVRRVDAVALNAAERHALLLAAGEKAQTSLDIKKGDLFRCLWFDFGSEEPGRLLWVMHHLAVDGVSWRILIPDLQAAYEERPLPEATTAWTAWAEQLPAVVSSRIGELPLWRKMA
ncbi:MAG: amino acid adenylation domain-containing protein, partial [Desulfovibrionales bacterium]|nr:amino acid adenylation domain-containing protein [Desulfovibrionales bacterium]